MRRPGLWGSRMLLTGLLGIVKITAVRRVVDALRDLRPAGFCVRFPAN